MIVGQNCEERFGAKREQFKFFVAQGQREDGQIDGEVAKALDKDGRGFFHDAEPGFRIFFCEGGGVARDQIRRNGRNGADGHATADVGALIFNAGARRFHLMQDGTSMGQEGAACLGKPDTAAEPVEKLGS